MRRCNDIHVTPNYNNPHTGKGASGENHPVNTLLSGVSFETLRERLEWWACHLGYEVRVHEPGEPPPVDSPFGNQGNQMTQFKCIFSPSRKSG